MQRSALRCGDEGRRWHFSLEANVRVYEKGGAEKSICDGIESASREGGDGQRNEAD